MALSQVVHQAIADNKYLLLQGGMRLEVEEMQDTVYSDEKWVRFILNQLIANAVKYRTEQPVLRISTHKRQDQIVLVVEDNGIGIAASDLPRIFGGKSRKAPVYFPGRAPSLSYFDFLFPCCKNDRLAR